MMAYPQPPQGVLCPKSISKGNFDDNGDESLVTYGEWLTKYPSALHAFEQRMMEIGKKKQIFVFLDYDGTLSPIVNDPEKAFMADEMRSALGEVGKHFPTAIVTGRSRDKALEFVKLKGLCYAGSHGMHISIPLGFLKQDEPPNDQTQIADEQGFINFCPAKEFLQELKKIKEKLIEKTNGIKGAMVEDNKFCISVHYRCVDEENVDKVKKVVDSVIKYYPDFLTAAGKKVIEVRPDIEWDKGHALEYLLKTFGFDIHDEVLPLYIGDDLSDEDAFKFMKKLGRGIPIVVSSKPKRTEALFSLRDTTEVMKFLTKLTEWRRSSSCY